jgi:hypothetical protein
VLRRKLETSHYERVGFVELEINPKHLHSSPAGKLFLYLYGRPGPDSNGDDSEDEVLTLASFFCTLS